MIPYIEVIGKYSLKSFAVIEPSECWFELSYYDIGEFEIYAAATSNNLNALKMGNYIKIPNKPYLWLIKSVKYTFNSEGARMIDVKGFEAKWILNQRVILQPYELETMLDVAVTRLVLDNLGEYADESRQITGFNMDVPDFSITIPKTQATRENLSDFVLALLKANGCGSYTTYENGQINYIAFQGTDKTESILFSQSMDNLITADYYESSENYKTFCRVVSTFNENDQSVDYIEDYNMPNAPANIDRHETIIQSNLSTKMKDGTEILPSSNTYKSMQNQEGKNKLAEHKMKKEFNGEIDLDYSHLTFGEDYFIGDLVKVRDEYFGYEGTIRILKFRYKQDASGYGEEAEYGTE